MFFPAQQQSDKLGQQHFHTSSINNIMHINISSFLYMPFKEKDKTRVQCDVMPGSMRTRIIAIFIVLLPGSLCTHHVWSGHVLLKLSPRYAGPLVSHRDSAVVHSSVLVHSSVSINQIPCICCK